MSCPHFLAQQVLAARLPRKYPSLGEIYEGLCQLQQPPAAPSEQMLYDYCNTDCARECPVFRQRRKHAIDNYKLAVIADDGEMLTIFVIGQKDSHAAGSLAVHYQIARGELLKAPENAVIHSQAIAYAHSYLRRKAKPHPPKSHSTAVE